MTLRLLVAYDGSGFSGFQIQPDQRTVQGAIETALERLAGHPVRVTCAGRTDAGVHALGQVVSVEESEHLHPEIVMRSMPALLPPDVAVVDAQTAPDGFSARFDARWREYVYLLWNHEVSNPLYRKYSVWSREHIDPLATQEALRAVVGTHDFTSFGRLRPEQSPERTIIEACAVADGPLLRIRIVGQTFLHQMVRSIVGTAIEVGTGRRPVSFMKEALEARNRAAAGRVAPARGLTLTDVGYDNVEWPRRTPVVWPWSDRAYGSAERGCA